MISGDILKQNIIRDEIIISDWDGVIQDIDIKWMTKLIDNQTKFNKYLDYNKLKGEDGKWDLIKVWSRNTYYYTNWLKKDNVKKIPEEIEKEVTSLYIDDIGYYFDIPFLIMADTLKKLSYEKFVKKIIFLSSAPKDVETDPRKLIMMNRFFKDNIGKFSIEVIHGNTPKSQYINEHYPDYTVFIDDRSDVVRDVIENTDSKNKQFILPIYGYNLDLGNDEEFITKCSAKGTIISTYKNEVLR